MEVSGTRENRRTKMRWMDIMHIRHDMKMDEDGTEPRPGILFDKGEEEVIDLSRYKQMLIQGVERRQINHDIKKCYWNGRYLCPST